MRFLSAFFVLFSALLVGCSDSDNNGNGGVNTNKLSYVNWDAVPDDMNPSVDLKSLNTLGVEKINIDFVGFEKDVSVIYSPDVVVGEAQLKIFKVWKKMASWGDLKSIPVEMS